VLLFIKVLTKILNSMLHSIRFLKHNFLILSLICITTSLFAQDPDKVEITIEQVNGPVHMLTGQGGNIGLLVGDDGVFMVDAQFAPLSAKILEAIKGLSPLPIKYLINTHWHGDHTGGNENVGKEGAIIVAQDNVRKRMSTEQLMKAFSRTIPASPEGSWPTITFQEDISFHMNDESVFIFHVHNAHTDGDAVVWFMKSNVIHMGDTYFNGRYPFIDISSSGSIEGIIKAMNQVLVLIDEDTKIIPGHGKISNKKEMTDYRDVLMIARDRVKKAIAKGMTIEEIQKADLMKDYNDVWGGGFINGEKFVDFIFTSLTKEKV
jgi:cyclase